MKTAALSDGDNTDVSGNAQTSPAEDELNGSAKMSKRRLTNPTLHTEFDFDPHNLRTEERAREHQLKEKNKLIQQRLRDTEQLNKSLNKKNKNITKENDSLKKHVNQLQAQIQNSTFAEENQHCKILSQSRTEKENLASKIRAMQYELDHTLTTATKKQNQLIEKLNQYWDMNVELKEKLIKITSESERNFQYYQIRLQTINSENVKLLEDKKELQKKIDLLQEKLNTTQDDRERAEREHLNQLKQNSIQFEETLQDFQKRLELQQSITDQKNQEIQFLKQKTCRMEQQQESLQLLKEKSMEEFNRLCYQKTLQVQSLNSSVLEFSIKQAQHGQEQQKLAEKLLQLEEIIKQKEETIKQKEQTIKQKDRQNANLKKQIKKCNEPLQMSSVYQTNRKEIIRYQGQSEQLKQKIKKLEASTREKQQDLAQVRRLHQQVTEINQRLINQNYQLTALYAKREEIMRQEAQFQKNSEDSEKLKLTTKNTDNTEQQESEVSHQFVISSFQELLEVTIGSIELSSAEGLEAGDTQICRRRNKMKNTLIYAIRDHFQQ